MPGQVARRGHIPVVERPLTTSTQMKARRRAQPGHGAASDGHSNGGAPQPSAGINVAGAHRARPQPLELDRVQGISGELLGEHLGRTSTAMKLAASSYRGAAGSGPTQVAVSPMVAPSGGARAKQGGGSGASPVRSKFGFGVAKPRSAAEVAKAAAREELADEEDPALKRRRLVEAARPKEYGKLVRRRSFALPGAEAKSEEERQREAREFLDLDDDADSVGSLERHMRDTRGDFTGLRLQHFASDAPGQQRDASPDTTFGPSRDAVPRHRRTDSEDEGDPFAAGDSGANASFRRSSFRGATPGDRHSVAVSPAARASHSRSNTEHSFSVTGDGLRPTAMSTTHPTDDFLKSLGDDAVSTDSEEAVERKRSVHKLPVAPRKSTVNMFRHRAKDVVAAVGVVHKLSPLLQFQRNRVRITPRGERARRPMFDDANAAQKKKPQKGAQQLAQIIFAKRLVFNFVKKHRKRRAHRADLNTDLAARAVEILRLPKDNRNGPGMSFIADLIGPEIQRSFPECTRDMVVELCRVAAHTHVNDKTVLFQQGTSARKFFIVLRGSLTFHQRDPYHQMVFTQELERVKASGSEQMSELASAPGPKVYVLFPGMGCGASALTDNQYQRPYTAVAGGDTDLISIDRIDYNRLFGQSDIKLLARKLELLKGMYLFRGWPHVLKVRLALMMRLQEAGPSTRIAGRGDSADLIYFIERGVVVETLRQVYRPPIAPRATGVRVAAADRRRRLGLPTKVLRTGGPDGEYPELVEPLPVDIPLKRAEQRPDGCRSITCELCLYRDYDVVMDRPLLQSTAYCSTDLWTETHTVMYGVDRLALERLLKVDAGTYGAKFLRRLKRIAEHREVIRQQQLVIARDHPDIEHKVTDVVMRSGKVPCCRCGQDGHISTDEVCPIRAADEAAAGNISKPAQRSISHELARPKTAPNPRRFVSQPNRSGRLKGGSLCYSENVDKAMRPADTVVMEYGDCLPHVQRRTKLQERLGLLGPSTIGGGSGTSDALARLDAALVTGRRRRLKQAGVADAAAHLRRAERRAQPHANRESGAQPSPVSPRRIRFELDKDNSSSYSSDDDASHDSTTGEESDESAASDGDDDAGAAVPGTTILAARRSSLIASRKRELFNFSQPDQDRQAQDRARSAPLPSAETSSGAQGFATSWLGNSAMVTGPAAAMGANVAAEEPRPKTAAAPKRRPMSRARPTRPRPVSRGQRMRSMAS